MEKPHLFQIWQLKRSPALREKRFVGLNELRKKKLPVLKEDYMMVWAATVEADQDVDCLEALYEQFNIYTPINFRGHLMSVSDVVVLDNQRAYYCDSIGWSQIKDWED